ncbi:hypothetical protein V1477_015137 [Vespula maculifrons]|uniref:Uncharacterized protein n=1 Tax=Vespula maculifrons TaxID=7453 RepID=A0ABD2BJE1_VESMC
MRAEECLWENALSVHSSANVIRLLTYSVISQVSLKEKGGLMVPNGGCSRKGVVVEDGELKISGMAYKGTVKRGLDVSMGSIFRTQEMMGVGEPMAPQSRTAL